MLERLLGLFRKPNVVSVTSVDAPSAQAPQIRRSLKERVLAMRPVDVGRGRFGQAIVGESHYQDVLRRVKHDAFITVGETPTSSFLVAREPDNPHD